MELAKYDGKYVRVTDKEGKAFTGKAKYADRTFISSETGGAEEGIFIEDCLIYGPQIVSIEETEVHGTVELRTEKQVLRRYRPEDADILYRCLGTDPEMSRYSGWNPYATPETARETVCRFIEGYAEEDTYSWVMDVDGVLVGTIGAYDLKDNRIEVGFSVVKAFQGRGLASDACRKVLEYLTENEGIPCITAWCAGENIGSRRVLEKAGMRLVRTEKDGLIIGESAYDKQIYEYRAGC